MKSYTYEIAEERYGKEAWRRRTNSKKRAAQVYASGMWDDTGAMYQRYYFGDYKRILYLDGRRIEDPADINDVLHD